MAMVDTNVDMEHNSANGESQPFSLLVFVHSFLGGMEGAGLRSFIPANGAVTVERHWIDDRGNPSSCKISTTWAGQPPRAERPGERPENQA